jgi:DNA invertase Pin-like site-specific DNA recombinase
VPTPTQTERQTSPRIYILARGSADIADPGHGNQVAELRAWAGRRGLDIAAEYVLDGASAWKGQHRDQLAGALACASTGRYDVVLAWALDRLSREGVEATLGLLRRFHAAGAPVWSLREPRTETADRSMAELLAAIYAWMARAESARRSERVRGAGAAPPRGQAGRPPARRDRQAAAKTQRLCGPVGTRT